MTEPRSLTVDKSLIERLQPQICCSESMATCKDDEFCASKPEEWQGVSTWSFVQSLIEGKKEKAPPKVRLLYPEDDDVFSLPGPVDFCSAYMSWYTQTGCGALAKEIANSLEGVNHCLLDTNFDDVIKKVLRKIPRRRRPRIERALRESLAKYVEPYINQCDRMSLDVQAIQEAMLGSCAIMYDEYDETDAGSIFNPERADDLHNIATFCQGIQEAEQKKFHWTTFYTGGGIVASLVIVWRVVRKIIKGLFKADTKLHQANTVIDSIVHWGTRLLKVSLPNLGKLALYFVTFGIVKPKYRTDDDLQTTKTQGKPEVPTTEAKKAKWGRPGTDPGIVPSANVVRTQLASLADSDKQEYAERGRRFNKLSPIAQEYMAHLAIMKWYAAPPEVREKRFAEDTSMTEATVPVGFLAVEFAGSYLAGDEKLDTIERSARVWAKRRGRKIPPSVPSESQFKPRFLIVVDQLVHDERYIKFDREVQNYLAKRAIAKWHHYSSKVRQTFVGPEDAPDKGVLPRRFVETFLEAELRDPEAIRRRALPFAQMIKRLPELDAFPFRLLETRVDVLLSHWENMPQAIKQEFWLMDGLDADAVDRHRLPKSFIEYMQPLLTISTKARKPLDPIPEPWDFGTITNPFYQKFDLRPIMKDLSEINPELPRYPEILTLRAHFIVDRWLALPKKIRTAFTAQDTDEGEEIGRTIPKSFINFLYQTPAVGKNSRPAVATSVKLPSVKDEPGDDDPEDRGGGKGGTPPPSGPASAGSGTPTGSPQEAKSQPANRVKTTVSVGGFCEITPSRSQQPKRRVPPAVWRRRRANTSLRGAGIMTGAQMVWPQIGISPNMIRPIPVGVAH